jgi:hypothetical protein
MSIVKAQKQGLLNNVTKYCNTLDHKIYAVAVDEPKAMCNGVITKYFDYDTPYYITANRQLTPAEAIKAIDLDNILSAIGATFNEQGLPQAIFHYSDPLTLLEAIINAQILLEEFYEDYNINI